MPRTREFLMQGADEHCEWETTIARLRGLAEHAAPVRRATPAA
jgi:hypothetical protein